MASIDIRDRNGNPVCQEWSDALGQTCCRLNPGDYRVSVACEGHGPYSRTVSLPAATGDMPRQRLDIALSSLSMLGGIVTDASGRRISGAKVLAWRSGARDSLDRSDSTDSQGRFLFRDLPEGKYRIFVRHSEYGEAESELTELEFSSDRALLRLQVSKPRVQVRGTVRDQDGKPVAGAEISVVYCEQSGQQKPFLGKSVKAGSRGEFLIGELTPGSADVMVQRPDFETAWKSVELASAVHFFDFQLQQSRRQGQP
jgi:protocatechuate 3,4-dioxygenase beta subunit